MVLLLKLIPIACIVRTLILSLPRRYFMIYLNNYFTSVPLFTELRAYNFSAIRITRSHAEFPRGMLALKDHFKIKLK